MVLPKIEDWKAPWETDLTEGEDPKSKLDLDKLKRYVHGVLGDKERIKGEIESVTAERDTLKAEKDAKAREGESELDRLTRERDELKVKAAKADEPDLEKLKLQVAIKKGLTETQMKRLVGTTLEEMSADADVLLAEWNPAAKKDDDGNEDDPSTQPKSGLRNPADPNPSEGRFDAEKAADDYFAGTRIF